MIGRVRRSWCWSIGQPRKMVCPFFCGNIHWHTTRNHSCTPIQASFKAWACLNGLVERSRAYRSFRLKFLSVRRGQKSNPQKFGAEPPTRRREPANLPMPADGVNQKQSERTTGWKASQQQLVQYWWKSKRKQICRNRKSRKSEQTYEQHWKWKELLHSNYKHLKQCRYKVPYKYQVEQRDWRVK